MSLREILLTGEEVQELVPVEYKAYSFEEAVLALLEGKTILVSRLEQSKKLDVVVRINPKRTPQVTEISYDTEPPKGIYKERYWFVYDLPLNVLSHFDVYSYDDAIEALQLPFRIGDKVKYTSIDNKKDLAYITDIFKLVKGEETSYLYQVSRDLGYYIESDLVSI